MKPRVDRWEIGCLLLAAATVAAATVSAADPAVAPSSGEQLHKSGVAHLATASDTKGGFAILTTDGRDISYVHWRDGAFSERFKIASADDNEHIKSFSGLTFVLDRNERLHIAVAARVGELTHVFHRKYSSRAQPESDWFNVTAAAKFRSQRRVPVLFPKSGGRAVAYSQGTGPRGTGLFAGEISRRGYKKLFESLPKQPEINRTVLYARVVGSTANRAQLLYAKNEQLFWSPCNRFKPTASSEKVKGLDFVALGGASIFPSSRGPVYVLVPLDGDTTGSESPFEMWVAAGRPKKRFVELARIQSKVGRGSNFCFAQTPGGVAFLFGITEEAVPDDATAKPGDGHVGYWKISRKAFRPVIRTALKPQNVTAIAAHCIDSETAVIAWGQSDGLFSGTVSLDSGN